MVNNNYKAKVMNLVEKAKLKGKIKKYTDFCNTENSKKYELSNEEVNYYTSKSEGATK